MSNFMTDFNEGKEVKVSAGGYEIGLIEIFDVDITTGEHSGNDYMAKNYRTDYFARFKLRIDGMEHIELQRLFLNEKGELSNPLRPRYTAKDGTEKPASLSYDIWQGMKQYLIEEGRTSELNELANFKGFSKERFTNGKFKMGYKHMTRQDGTDYIIIETDYQKLKDEEYKKKEAAKKASQRAINNDEDMPIPSDDNSDINPEDLPF